MFGRLGHVFTDDPLRIPRGIVNRWCTFWVSHKQNVDIAGRLILSGRPLIDIRKDCRLHIGDGVLLNSRNRRYHVNMHSPVKLLADRPGAQIRIGDKTRIHGTCIHAYQLIEVGCRCLIAANCQIFDNNGHDLSFPDVSNRINTIGNSSKPVIIGDDVWIGANSIVLPGVTIGRGSVISAGSVVHQDVPSMVIAGGNPIRIIRDHSGT